MRDLRFSAFLMIAVLSSAGWTQTTKPSTTQQLQLPEGKQAQGQTPAPTTPAGPSAENEQSKESPTLRRFKVKVVPQKARRHEKEIPIGSFDRGLRAAIQLGKRNMVDPVQVAEDFRKEMDRGIRLSPGAGMCGSIVSYNFSPSALGEVPHLESVTTCTPADKVVQRRAQNPGRKPSPPQLLKTSSQER